MDAQQLEARLKVLEGRQRRAWWVFLVLIAGVVIALIAVGHEALRDHGPVTSLDRRVVRSILRAHYVESHPVPPGSQDSPEARDHQSLWMDYEAHVMRRFDQTLVQQGIGRR